MNDIYLHLFLAESIQECEYRQQCEYRECSKMYDIYLHFFSLAESTQQFENRECRKMHDIYFNFSLRMNTAVQIQGV